MIQQHQSLVTENQNLPSSVHEFNLLQRMGNMLFSSGLFPDIKNKVQAMVKIMAGKELGLAPFASITGIHIVQGKPILGANLIATLIANHPYYSYKTLKCTKEICEIEFFENKESTGKVSFSIQEAQEASLLGRDNWKKYPSDMLFARAISRGARRYAPGIFGGSAVYTPDELNCDIDEDGHINSVKFSKPTVISNIVDYSDEKIIEDIEKEYVISPGAI